MKLASPHPLPDGEQTQAHAEGAEISRLCLALAVGCFLIIVILATLTGGKARLGRWLLRFLPSICPRNPNKIQPTQTPTARPSSLTR